MKFTDQTMERVVANLLRGGVMLSAAVILAGGIGYMVQHGQELPSYRNFQGEPPSFRDISGIVKGAARLDWRAVIQFGLLLLIATPVARVAFSIAGFAAEKDRTYVFITTLVLAILLCGMIWKP